jgi:hypothetical protein
MWAGWKLMWLAAIIFAVAYAAERLFVPDVVPVGYADQPQALWAVECAFVLRAIELMAAGAGLIVGLIMAGAAARRLWRRHAL